MERKQGTSIRLTQEARRLLRLLADRWGVSQAAVLELLIRQCADKEGLK